MRYRRRGIEERARDVHRIQKVLEGVHIKLGSVISDVLGISGRAMLRALAQGEKDVERLAALAVAHSICQRIGIVLDRGEPYADLGGDYFIPRDQETTKRKALRNLEGLGYQVTLVSRLS